MSASWNAQEFEARLAALDVTAHEVQHELFWLSAQVDNVARLLDPAKLDGLIARANRSETLKPDIRKMLGHMREASIELMTALSLLHVLLLENPAKQVRS